MRLMCNYQKSCTGFTFKSGKGGCLKRCGKKEFGGYLKSSYDYWAKGKKIAKKGKKSKKASKKSKKGKKASKKGKKTKKASKDDKRASVKKALAKAKAAM